VAQSPDIPKIGTTAGVLAFLAGGLGTILAVVSDWGSDASGIAAARRNHVVWLQFAGVLAVCGLFFGAFYTIARQKLTWWQRALLLLGVMSVSAGLCLGIVSTTKREVGRPSVQIERVDRGSVRVTVRGEGQPSDASFFMRVDAYGPMGEYLDDLMFARLSPNQSGELNWSQRIGIPRKKYPWNYQQTDQNGKPTGKTVHGQRRIKRVQVNLTEEAVLFDKDHPEEALDCGKRIPTCVYLRLPDDRAVEKVRNSRT
jgi:hypothetical protein